MERCSSLKGEDRRLAQGEDTQEQVAVHMCGFHRIWRGNYFGRKSTRRAEVEVRVGKHKNGKAAGGNEVIGERIKAGDDRVVED